MNVRATPAQYARWRRAADRAGLSLSNWTARWLDELSGGYPRVLQVLEKEVPRYSGRMPVRDLRCLLSFRWEWTDAEIDRALLELEQEGLVTLHLMGDPSRLGRLACPQALERADGTPLTHVGLPIGRRPRQKRHAW